MGGWVGQWESEVGRVGNKHHRDRNELESVLVSMVHI
jgi:hypothetical protein